MKPLLAVISYGAAGLLAVFAALWLHPIFLDFEVMRWLPDSLAGPMRQLRQPTLLARPGLFVTNYAATALAAVLTIEILVRLAQRSYAALPLATASPPMPDARALFATVLLMLAIDLALIEPALATSRFVSAWTLAGRWGKSELVLRFCFHFALAGAAGWLLFGGQFSRSARVWGTVIAITGIYLAGSTLRTSIGLPIGQEWTVLPQRLIHGTLSNAAELTAAFGGVWAGLSLRDATRLRRLQWGGTGAAAALVALAVGGLLVGMLIAHGRTISILFSVAQSAARAVSPVPVSGVPMLTMAIATAIVIGALGQIISRMRVMLGNVPGAVTADHHHGESCGTTAAVQPPPGPLWRINAARRWPMILVLAFTFILSAFLTFWALFLFAFSLSGARF